MIYNAITPTGQYSPHKTKKIVCLDKEVASLSPDYRTTSQRDTQLRTPKKGEQTKNKERIISNHPTEKEDKIE